MAIVAAVLVSTLALFLLSEQSKMGAAILCGGCALVALGRSVAYTRRRREWLVLALLLIELFASVNFIDESVLTPVHYGLIACFALPILLPLWRSGILRKGGFALFAIYLGWGLVTVTYSEAPMYSFARLVNTAMLVGAVVWATLEVRSAQDVLKLMGIFVIGCAVFLVVCAVGTVALPQDRVWYSDAQAGNPEASGLVRYCGVFLTPNQVGMLMLATLGPALLCLDGSRGRKRILILLAIMSAIGFAVIADSRTSFVGIVCGCALYVIWRYRWRAAFAAVALAGILALGKFAQHQDFWAYVARGNVTTLTGRTDVWNFAVHSIEERPLTGYGYEAGGMIYRSKYFPLWWGPWDEGPRSSLHNNYLGHAVEVGIPATILWLFIVLRPWLWVLRRTDDPWNLKPVFFLVVVPILVLGLGESTAGDCRYSVGLLFMIAWAIAERARLLAIESDRRARRQALAQMPRAAGALAGLLVIALFVALTPLPAAARDYYVDSTRGLDSNGGAAPSAALRTLGSVARLRLNPGDRVLLARGRIWHEELKIDPPWRGEPGRPITLGAYGSGRAPVISGVDQISGFERACNGACYAAAVAVPVMRVFEDGDGFVADRIRQTPAELIPGSWAYAGGLLYLRLTDDAPPPAHRIEISRRPWGVRCWQCPGVTIQDLEITGTWDDGINFDGPEGDLRATQDLTVRRCLIHDIGRGDFDETGVQAGSTYAREVVVEGNRIYRIGMGRGFGFNPRSGGGIGILFNRCQHCIARDNDVSEAGHIGIAVQVTEDGGPVGPQANYAEVAGNRIHDCPGSLPGLDRADAIYLRRAAAVRVADNRIWNIDSPEAGAGNAVHIGRQCARIEVTGNRARNCAGGVYIDDDYDASVRVANNIFSGMGMFFVRSPSAPPGAFTFNGNNYSGAAPSAPFVLSGGGFGMGSRLSLGQWRALGQE